MDNFGRCFGPSEFGFRLTSFTKSQPSHCIAQRCNCRNYISCFVCTETNNAKLYSQHFHLASFHQRKNTHFTSLQSNIIQSDCWFVCFRRVCARVAHVNRKNAFIVEQNDLKRSQSGRWWRCACVFDAYSQQRMNERINYHWKFTLENYINQITSYRIQVKLQFDTTTTTTQ